MVQTRLATRIDDRVKKAVEEVCNARGLKMNRFIEDALIDKLKELEDIEDLIKIRRVSDHLQFRNYTSLSACRCR
jgi:hypothetical protein